VAARDLNVEGRRARRARSPADDRCELVLDDLRSSGRAVRPADPRLAAACGLDEDERRLVPLERAVGTSTTGVSTLDDGGHRRQLPGLIESSICRIE
jgi:hypothetical protein